MSFSASRVQYLQLSTGGLLGSISHSMGLTPNWITGPVSGGSSRVKTQPVCFNQLRSQKSKAQFGQFMPRLRAFSKPPAVCAIYALPFRRGGPSQATGKIRWEYNNRLMWRARPRDQTCLTLMPPLYIIQRAETLDVSDGIQGQGMFRY